MWKKTIVWTAILVLLPLATALCTPEGDEPVQVTLPVAASGARLEAVTNAEGWTVTVSEFRLAAADFEFTIEGETHASAAPSQWQQIVGIRSAWAHPGHYAGGEVTGELLGNFIWNLSDELQPLGDATLLTEDYNGANLHYRLADDTDGLDAEDPLLGHTAYIEGEAEKDDVTVAFTAIIDVEEDTEMVGAPFELSVSEETAGTIVWQVLTLDPSEGDTMFDGLDFDALDEDGDGVVEIVPDSDAHNVFMKTLIRHDHYNAAFDAD